MQWFINDLSLDGQFPTPYEFRTAIEPLLALRRNEKYLQDHLYCSWAIGDRPVTHNHSFKQAMYALSDKTFKHLVLKWITKRGPFWDNDRYANPDDYFEFQGIDVTDQGLGEAARRCIYGINAGTYSLTGSSRFDFETSPLKVQHGLSEKPIGWLDVDNLWDIDKLKVEIANARYEPQTWKEVIEYAQHDFPRLILASGPIAEQLKAHPFSQYLASRISQLLGILDSIAEETDEDGSLSDLGIQLRDNHFVGEKAWFTDESANNKNRFKNELTFPDPAAPGDQLFCSWHGKIKTPQFRIHFEWPPPKGQRKIKVVYIGPKITKK